jgi:hypothetical protein
VLYVPESESVPVIGDEAKLVIGKVAPGESRLMVNADPGATAPPPLTPDMFIATGLPDEPTVRPPGLEMV